MQKPGMYNLFTPEPHDDVFYLQDAPAKLKHLDSKLNWRSLYYCATRGRKGASHANVKLRVCRLSGGLGTTVKEFIEFLEKLNA